IGHLICASTGTNYLSIGFTKRLCGHGPQQGATPGADHPVWGTSAEFPCRAGCQTNARSGGRPTESSKRSSTERKAVLAAMQEIGGGSTVPGIATRAQPTQEKIRRREAHLRADGRHEGCG